jgi:choline dehydrogenase-like flavoprotein
MPHFQKSVTFTGPNNDLRGDNVSTVWDQSAFAADGQGGPVQVTYTNYVSSFATWLEKALDSLGLTRTDGFSNGKLLGYHYAQATIRNKDQTRSSSASYVYQAMSGSGPAKKNLKVFTQTLAKEIIFDGKKATGQLLSKSVSYARYTMIVCRTNPVSYRCQGQLAGCTAYLHDQGQEGGHCLRRII